MTVPSYSTSPLIVPASTLDDLMPVRMTSPFVVSTLISPVMLLSATFSLTEFTSIRPEASVSVTLP